jgi:hypothetical protein
MSGLIGHTMYAVLGVRAAAQRRLPIASVIQRHWASYLAGAYLGCDIQTMPEAVCVQTGKQVGYGTVPIEKSPLTGGSVRPFLLTIAGKQYTPRDIHHLFYGRSHLTFGWSRAERQRTLPWDHLPDYCAAVAEDAVGLFGPGERPLAYALGWMTHLVGDGLIKSIAPGVTLHLLDGKYTAKNRPLQDLVTFHEIGCKELHLNWPALFADLSETPVEPLQLHFMRVAPPRGRLAQDFPHDWAPDQQELLLAVLGENRRWLRVHREAVLQQVALQRTAAGWQCSAEMCQTAGGLSYAQMVQAAEKASFRHALWQIAEAVAELFAQIVPLVAALRDLPNAPEPSWTELGKRWGTL